jgi:hypothetical protein
MEPHNANSLADIFLCGAERRKDIAITFCRFDKDKKFERPRLFVA